LDERPDQENEQNDCDGRNPAPAERRLFQPLLRQSVDPLGQGEVELGQAAFAVGRKNQANLIVADVDVRMVLLFVRHFGYGIDEIDRIGKVIELKGALDVFLLQLPPRGASSP
jgi:hypothetical protein